MTKIFIPEGSREIYVSDVGNDSNDGGSLMFPKLTLSEGIALAVSFTPGPLSTVAILDPSNSVYIENFPIPDSVFVDMPNVMVHGDAAGGVAVAAGAEASATYSAISVSVDGATAYSTGGKDRSKLIASTINLSGLNQTGVLVDASSSECSIAVGHIIATNAGATGVDHTASGGPHTYVFSSIIMSGVNSTGFKFNSASGKATSVRLGSISDSGAAGSIALDIVAGVVSISVNDIVGDIFVRSGATLNLTDGAIIGNITVEAGGTLNIKSSSHTGTVTDNGIINGTIYDTIGETTDTFGVVDFIDPVSIGSGGGDASAALTVNSTTQGLLPPRMTETQRDAISSPTDGLQVFNITADEFQFFKNAEWRTVVDQPGGGSVVLSVAGGDNINTTGTASDPVINLDDIIEGTGSNGALVMRGAANSPIGGTVQISGGGASTTGGSVAVTGGFGGFNGGSASLLGGDGTDGFSGNAIIRGGNGDEQTPGGDVAIGGGRGGFDGGKGGDINLTSGDAEGPGEDSGEITLDAGTSQQGNVADILLARASGSVGIGAGFVQASAILEIDSTTHGFLTPRMTTTQRNAISSPATGLEIYNTTTNEPNFFNGSVWVGEIGAETLAETLALGSITGGSDISISSGDSIVSPDGSNGAPIDLTAGAGTAGAGGALNLAAGDGTFAGGEIGITSGSATTSGPGATISLQSGSGVGASAGGQVHVFAGIGGSSNGTGGQLLVHAGGGGNPDGDGGLLSLEGGQGAASGNTDGGDVDIQGGTNFGSGAHGSVLLQKTAGFVGIGVSNPASVLDIESSASGNLLRLSADIGNSAAVLNINSERTTAGNVGIINFTHNNVNVAQVLGIVTDEPNDFGDLRFSTKGSSGFIQRMVIDQDGQVGIGTNNPARALDVHRGDAVYIGISDNSQERFLVGYTEGESFNGTVEDNVSQTQILADTNGDLHLASRSNQASGINFYTTKAATTIAEQRMRIDGNGVVTIGGEVASRVAPQTIEIFTAADLDAIASGGVITISTQTAIILKANVTTSNRFDVESGNRFTIGNGGQGYALTYSGADTLITSIDSIIVLDASLTATGGGTLFDVSGEIGTIINVAFVLLSGWKMGTIRRSPGAAIGPDVFFLHMSALNWQDTLTLENVSVLTVDEDALIPFAGSGVPFLELKGDTPGSYAINLVSGSLAAGESLVRIDPGIANGSQIVVTGSVLGGAGVLFDTSGGITGTFASVFDQTVALTTIDSVTDSSGVARFNFTVGPTLFVDQEVAIENFVTETTYNQTGVITATGAGFFEVASIAFTADDATGDFSSDSVQLFETATALSDGDTLVIDTDDGTEYDGGATVYGKDANTFRINRVFSITASGTWDTAGIDQKDARVLARGNPGFSDSKNIAAAFVNNNTTGHPAITNNTFSDMAFGTGGVGLIAASNLERWKLIDSVVGIFEYIGNEPFDGALAYGFTSTSSGGSTAFRFKWLKDTGSGFAVLPDDVESLVEVGSDASSVSTVQSLTANKGDQIKPQVTRNSGASSITTSYATVSATQ